MVILDRPAQSPGQGNLPPMKPQQAPATVAVRCRKEVLDVSGPFKFSNMSAVTMSKRYPKKLQVAMGQEEYHRLRKRVEAKVDELFGGFVDGSPDINYVPAPIIPVLMVKGARREKKMKDATKHYAAFLEHCNKDLQGRSIRLFLGQEQTSFVGRGHGHGQGGAPLRAHLYMEAPVPIEEGIFAPPSASATPSGDPFTPPTAVATPGKYV
mmetsp:Transcript_8721/g.36344  ORF Transcript_8721/g.36344 Transcript_8721/m.36344 type:complete len:210 (-) Transcript_8721:67-696(-)